MVRINADRLGDFLIAKGYIATKVEQQKPKRIKPVRNTSSFRKLDTTNLETRQDRRERLEQDKRESSSKRV